MMQNSIIVDSSFLIALNIPTDNKHQLAYTFANLNRRPLLIPNVVLTEVTYLLERYGGQAASIRFLRSPFDTQQSALLPLNADDLQRVADIKEQYHNVALDFVDCCIMAFAERLNITRVCTFDRRDFSIFRPKHCPYFELVP